MSQLTESIPPISSLSLEAKAAQMIMIDIPGLELSEPTRAHLTAHPWNGVILFAKNVSTRQQVVDLVNQIHEAGSIVPLMTVDQEGGLVDRFRFDEMTLSPGPMALAATGDPEATFEAHRIMGREMASLGIHLDFAPCLDVNCNPDNPIIGVRSFGDDPELVGRHGQAAIRGLREGGVGSTAKHFPGHGDTSQDSHIALATVPHSRERLEQVELAPFRAAIGAEVEAIMTAHITFPAFDPTPGLPATLSRPILTGLLREQMGFEGLIFTDSMAMLAIADRFGVAEAAVMSVEAGADVVLACGPFQNHLESLRGLVEAVQSGRLAEERLDASLERIFALKRRFCERPTPVNYDLEGHRRGMASIVDRTITVLRQQPGVLPLRGKTLVLMPDLLPQTPLGEVSRSESLAAHMTGVETEEKRYHSHGDGPALTMLAQQAGEFANVVVAVYGRDRLPDSQRDLIRLLLEQKTNCVVVSLASPYLLAHIEAPNVVLSYNYTPLSLNALGRVLTGQLQARGKCPVNLG